MATAEWAQSLNDATLDYGLQRAAQRVTELRAELANEQETLDVLTAEFDRRQNAAEQTARRIISGEAPLRDRDGRLHPRRIPHGQ